MFIPNELRVLLAGDKPWDGVHGAGTVEGDDRGDILNVLGLEAGAHTGHPRALHLEHPRGAPLREHAEGLRVVIRYRR
ncbi:hypothetical protein SDC9_132103 [bioreactor metagenome]|uniref:Uncharacterized protein n=1 Tax=bioreactor metagenome TaxID=1076179 RepID=A0A645D6M6_9ZZZZ